MALIDCIVEQSAVEYVEISGRGTERGEINSPGTLSVAP